MTPWEAARRYSPALLNAAVITIVLSCLSMALRRRCRGAHRERPHLRERSAAHRAGRIRRGHLGDAAAAAAVRSLLRARRIHPAAGIRGGACSASVSTTPPMRARFIAARSRPCRPGQLDAARTLGFSERQILMLVRAPQAFRLALAPMTNDSRRAAERQLARLGDHRR